MATVTGLAAARMKVIEDASVVSGGVTGDELILTTRGGVNITAGNVRGPQGDQGIQGPVGEVSQAAFDAAVNPILSRLSALELRANSLELDLSTRGIVAYNKKNTLQQTVGTAYNDVTGLSVTFNARADRTYKVTTFTAVSASAITNFTIQLARAGSIELEHQETMSPQSGWDGVVPVAWVGGLASGSQTISVRAKINNGVLSLLTESWLIVEDVGPLMEI